jgi:hypothetical protein
MAADQLLTRAGGLVLGACLMALSSAAVAGAVDPVTRIVLLSAGERASVVVEFDNETPNATAVEATDSQSFDVEIGPVHSKVTNQWLQAATRSPLVTDVRVRAVPQGAQGTLVALHVTTKTPVSGLVRRAQRRIYIDLEPQSIAAASRQPRPVAVSILPTPATPAPTPSPALTASTSGDEFQRRAELLARQSDVKRLEKLKTDLVARQAATAAGAAAATDAPDPAIDQIDQYLDEARKKRLLADAGLFTDSNASPAAPAAIPARASPPPDLSPQETFWRNINPLIPELEMMNAMLSEWQPGFIPVASLPQTMEALAIRVRAVRPPTSLGATHERLSAALSALAKSWVPGTDGVTLIPVGNDARLVVSAKGALYDYLQVLAVEGATGPARSPQPSS